MTNDGVLKLIDKLQVNKSAEPDDIRLRVLLKDANVKLLIFEWKIWIQVAQ